MEDYVHSKDVIKKFNITRQTLYVWEKKGMPYIRLATGGKRYLLSEVEEWNKQKAKELKL